VSDYAELIAPGRWVLVKSGIYTGEVAKAVEWDHGFEMWVVNVFGTEVFKEVHELEPVFTMNQIVDVKLEESHTPDLVKKVIPFGMSSDQLAEEVGEFIIECTSRITGVGQEQYAESSHQKFEEMDLDDLFEYAEEELRDIANYAAFLVIRLRRIRAALNAADDLGDGTEEEYAAGDITADDFKDGQ